MAAARTRWAVDIVAAGAALLDGRCPAARSSCAAYRRPARLHLVGVRRPVDAAVGKPPGRQPGPPPPSDPAALLGFAGGPLEHLPEVDILVELRELSGAGSCDRLLERVGERPRLDLIARVVAITFAGNGVSPAFTGSSGRASSDGVGEGSGSPTIRRYSRAASSSRSSSPSGIHTSFA